MTRKSIKNIPAAIRQRLLNKARNMNRPFNELLQYFAMERFLYRLSKSPHADKFILKGALMLTVWKAPFSRPTNDIDLLGRCTNDLKTLATMIKDICQQDVEPDGIRFDAGSVKSEKITIDKEYEGIRFRLYGNLDTARIPMQIDIGFGDVVEPSTEQVEYPTLLDLPSPRISGYTRESTVAEKLEAMVKLGILNSRMKDFFDIWLLSRRFDFSGQSLSIAINRTFSRRGTKIDVEPVAFKNDFANDSSKMTQWRGFIRKNRLDNVPEDFSKVIVEISTFLKPITDAISTGQIFKGKWSASGPWVAGFKYR